MTEPATDKHARRRWVRHLGRGLLAVTGLGALIVACAFLPRSLGEVRVEDARLHPVPGAYDIRKPAYHATPVRIAVTFTAGDDLEAVRRRRDLGYIAARLADCRHGAAETLEVVTQRAEYLREDGRVRRQGEADGGSVRYRVEFDDVLTEFVDYEPEYTSALATPGGLCFSLYGASMWFGWGWSNTVTVEVRP